MQRYKACESDCCSKGNEKDRAHIAHEYVLNRENDRKGHEGPIGYLIHVPSRGRGYCVICLECAANNAMPNCELASRVYPINIRPYRQICVSCNKVLVQSPMGEALDALTGKHGFCELYDGK